MMKVLGYMAIDQYGQRWDNGGYCLIVEFLIVKGYNYVLSSKFRGNQRSGVLVSQH